MLMLPQALDIVIKIAMKKLLKGTAKNLTLESLTKQAVSKVAKYGYISDATVTMVEKSIKTVYRLHKAGKITQEIYNNPFKHVNRLVQRQLTYTLKKEAGKLLDHDTIKTLKEAKKITKTITNPKAYLKSEINKQGDKIKRKLYNKIEAESKPLQPKENTAYLELHKKGLIAEINDRMATSGSKWHTNISSLAERLMERTDITKLTSKQIEAVTDKIITDVKEIALIQDRPLTPNTLKTVKQCLMEGITEGKYSNQRQAKYEQQRPEYHKIADDMDRINAKRFTTNDEERYNRRPLTARERKDLKISIRQIDATKTDADLELWRRRMKKGRMTKEELRRAYIRKDFYSKRAFTRGNIQGIQGIIDRYKTTSPVFKEFQRFMGRMDANDWLVYYEYMQTHTALMEFIFDSGEGEEERTSGGIKIGITEAKEQLTELMEVIKRSRQTGEGRY